MTLEETLIRCRDLLAAHIQDMGEDQPHVEEVIDNLNKILSESQTKASND